ncbi:GH116 family glycosyl hydrolase [Acutalibacter caecimuris]|uniref:GH116 family glycosyl hydrolase n=1 Tax=Acutalibacter caecimuris TaxID=3093657 RepID=UPI002AC99D8E|nr:GH116 family glycosyl hydrolase [Acutalibacter sp. M00118]
MDKSYTGRQLEQVSFPVGGMGAGMFCVEGTGAIGSLSLRNAPDLFYEPECFSALYARRDGADWARVLEGPVPRRKIFGGRGTLSGLGTSNQFGKTYGLPRFRANTFTGRFPFARLAFQEEGAPLEASMTAFSPFLPGNEDDSCLPAATLRYTFENRGDSPVEAVYSFHTVNFMVHPADKWFPSPIREEPEGTITRQGGGLLLACPAREGDPAAFGQCLIQVGEAGALCHTDWFPSGWFDPLTMLWKGLAAGETPQGERADGKSLGGSLAVRFCLQPGERREIDLHFAWYVPKTNLRLGYEAQGGPGAKETYRPWYAGRFGNVEEVMAYYRGQFTRLWEESAAFSRALFASTLPEGALDALACNLSILKSPTILRQADGRLWAWEGCCDNIGSCHGSCTHVWNYAQALCHLFPRLERSFRDAEFHEDQNGAGHQEFRSSLPIRPSGNTFHAAADGQLGGIMKMYREWRIGGDIGFIRAYWPLMKKSLDYCIGTWDKGREGVLKEPHHNTYDIEFWGADGMCSSFYLGALVAISRMGRALGEDVTGYEQLYRRGRAYLETRLFNGAYFVQQVEWETLQAPFDLSGEPEACRALMEREGPKYQYGAGCISDGVMGAWLARVCGLGDILDPAKVKSHLLAVYRHNFKPDLTGHANPQRPGYALGNEGGLLLCTWPQGGRPSLPFVYSDEVWTGIEHQVAAHLMLFGCVEEAKSIIAASRARYDGAKRNPFDEYECGHWYARALASYSYLQAYTGVRYDAVEKTLYASGQNAPAYAVFLSTATGYGVVTLQDGRVDLQVVRGEIPVERVVLA